MSKPVSIIGGLFFIVLFIVGFIIAQSCEEKDPVTIKRTQILLGTVVEIQVKGVEEEKAAGFIQNTFEEIKRIDDLFTTYDEESPVWISNNSEDNVIVVDEEIYKLMVLCDSVYKLSEGSFDVSLNHLIETWKFNTEEPVVPTQESIDSALTMSGWKNISLQKNNAFTKTNDVQLNFGAVAKGYAVDRAIFILDSLGVKKALVNAGGEIKSIGDGWVIGVQHPGDPNNILKKIKLKNNSVATSGDYEQFFIEKGKRYHHILNPETGYPAGNVQSATVIHQNNTFADAVATAVFVMGEIDGISLIEKLDSTEAMMVDENGDIIFSTGFKKYIVE